MNMEIVSIEKKTFEMMVAAFGALSEEYRNNRVLPFILLGGKVLYPETGLREVLEANYRKPLE